MTDLRLDHIECADVMDYLRTLPDQCVNLVVTSPPYFGLRSYLPEGHDDKAREIGAEQTPAAYIARMVAVFAEVRRVLRDDGNVYVNLGDSYGDKQLLGIPWRFVFAMQDAGWLFREDIIWGKGNPMPESVRDRCTRSHEYIFHFTKQPRYWYDQDAVREPHKEESLKRYEYGLKITRDENAIKGSLHDRLSAGLGNAERMGDFINMEGRNRRSVWTINPANFREAHFATFPEDIPEICIKAACPEWCCEKCGAPYEAQVETTGEWRAQHDREQKHDGQYYRTNPGGGVAGPNTSRTTVHHGYAPSCTCNAGKRGGVVLDPFMGAGTVAMVAKRLHRFYIGCDLNAEYVRMARARVYGPLFSYEGAGS